MKKLSKTLKNSEKAITLIALVITIIVLLILAGISISMLAGDNSILSRTAEAKLKTEISQIEEVIKLAYMDLVGKEIAGDGNEANLDKAVEEVKKDKAYKDKIISISGGAYKLSSTDVILAKSGTDNNQTLTIEEDTSASSGATYYAVISGKYYKIEQTNGNIKIAKEPSYVDPNNTTDTINITDDDVTIAKTSDNKDIATFEVIEENKVKVTASSTNEGKTTITIRVNGKTYTANLSVVGAIQNAPATLDGALELLAATDNSNQNGTNVNYQNIEMTTSNPDVATITTEGIVKCNKSTGEAIVSAKQGDTTKYFKVISTATLATSKMTTNKTINNETSGTSDNPLIPAGFYAVNTEKAKWIYDNATNKVTDADKGLVIIDEKGNQFVWVPVRNPNSMYGTLSDGKKAGKLYTAWSGTGSSGTKSALNWTEQNGVMSITSTNRNREPSLLSSYYVNSSYLSIISDLLYSSKYGTKYKDTANNIDKYGNRDNFGKTLQEEFDSLIASVIQNGGFYIGRYEASLINDETRVVAGATSMSATDNSANKWYGLYARQRAFADDNELDSVDSSMIWGSQYDAMINWMQDTGIDVTADRSNINKTKIDDDENRRTGVLITDKLNNIYDLFGLRYEWTLEATEVQIRLARGGYYGSRPPSIRAGRYGATDITPIRDTKDFRFSPYFIYPIKLSFQCDSGTEILLNRNYANKLY